MIHSSPSPLRTLFCTACLFILVATTALAQKPKPGTIPPNDCQTTTCTADIQDTAPQVRLQVERVTYALDAPGMVYLALYDARGHEVAVLALGHRPAGRYTAPWPTHGAADAHEVRLQVGTGSAIQPLR